jgi:hypothetical protein
LRLFRNQKDPRFDPVIAFLRYAIQSGLFRLLGKEGAFCPVFRHVNTDKTTVDIYGGPHCYMDLIPLKGKDPTCKNKEITTWYSPSPGVEGVMQSLTPDWLSAKVKEVLKHSPIERSKRLKGHCF